MKPLRSWRSVVIAIGLGLLAALGSVPSRAEVGIVWNPANSEIQSVYILQSIIDDTEPVGTAWVRYSADLPHRVILNDQGYANQDGKPDVLVQPATRIPLAVWSRHGAGGYDLVFSRFVAGAWTPPEVFAGSPADERDPHLAVDPTDGTVHVVYWMQDPEPRVLHTQAPSDLSGWSSPLQISGPGELACRPALAVHGGIVKVAYEVHEFGYGTTPKQVVLATFDGSEIDYELLAMSQFEGELWPEVHSASDKVWVDWVDTVGEMTWTRQTTGQTWEPVQMEPFVSIEERDFSVRRTIRSQAVE